MVDVSSVLSVIVRPRVTPHSIADGFIPDFAGGQ
jgi:hypothetical protein